MIGEFLDSTIRPNEELPRISRRAPASLRRILHRHSPRRARPKRQFLYAQILHIGAGVPVDMEGEEQVVLIIDERRLNFVSDVGRFAVDLGPNIGDLDRLAVLIFSLVGDSPGLGLPNPRAGDIHSGEL